jgi:transposase
VSKTNGQLGQAQAVEIARLKRQLAEQAEELALLKKASAYFAKHLK